MGLLTVLVARTVMNSLEDKYYEVCIIGYKNSVYTYHLDKKIKNGVIVEVKLRGKSCQGVVLQSVQKPSFKTNQIDKVTEFYFPLKYMDIVSFLSRYYCASLGESFSIFKPFLSSNSHESSTKKLEIDISLSTYQQKAFDEIVKSNQPLLFGVTGSGKSEIFMKLFEKYINEGKRVLFLMPEISLTSQMKKRLQHFFGDSVIMWHSKVTKKAKEKMLEKLYDGSSYIIAGARSALFLPIKDLGLIVVDEEHDDSYKSFSNPKLNAKDMALYMGKMLDAKVLLASATPSVSSYVSRDIIRLDKTFYNSKKEYIFDDGISGLSNLVLKHISEALLKNEQIMVFVPTRANFKYLVCKSCGIFAKCPYCSVGMSIHTSYNVLRCHYCNFAKKIPQVCEECGGELESQRLGTEEITKTLREFFPDNVIEKFDKDSITTNKKLESTLSKFNQKKIDILVGTQMLSKGHDYLGVKLAVVIGLDYILAIGDYRAMERAVSLMHQVSGRCARSGEGKVIIQSKNREFFEKYLFDYEKFLKDEMNDRKDLYPPYVRFMRFLFVDKNQKIALENMNRALRLIEDFEDVEVVGAGQAAIETIAGKHRYYILLRAKKATLLIKAYHLCKDIKFDVDMDPVNFS